MTNNTETPKKVKTKKSLSLITWLIIIVGIIATIVIWIMAKPPITVVKNTAPSGFSVQGVAINQTSGYVDYNNLATNGIDFTYLRATSGVTFADDGYQASYDRAQGAHLKVGSIQVYDASVDAATQAQYFIDKVGNNIGQLPIAIYVTNDQIATKSSKERLAVLIQSLSTHYNRDIVIYTTPNVQQQLNQVIKKTKYWLIADNTDNRATANQFIQYSEDHTIGKGLKAVKMPTSVFNGTRQQFKEIK